MALNFNAIKQAVSQARREAHIDAKRHGRTVRCPFVRSRGTFIATIDDAGQCAPYEEACAYDWNGTKREIVETVAKVLDGYPNVKEVYIAGGFDIAETIDFDDYEPQVSNWSVTVWTAADGYVDPKPTNEEVVS